jgi:hypothetical protein
MFIINSPAKFHLPRIVNTLQIVHAHPALSNELSHQISVTKAYTRFYTSCVIWWQTVPREPRLRIRGVLTLAHLRNGLGFTPVSVHGLRSSSACVLVWKEQNTCPWIKTCDVLLYLSSQLWRIVGPMSLFNVLTQQIKSYKIQSFIIRWK